MFSSFDRKTRILRKYVMFDKIKKKFLRSSLRVLIYVNNVSTNVTYINNWLQNTFQNLLATSLHISLLIFHILITYLTSQHSPISSHGTFCLKCSTSLSTFQLSFKISHLICFACSATRELFKSFTILKSLANVSNGPTKVTRSVSTPCARTAKEERNNIQLTF